MNNFFIISFSDLGNILGEKIEDLSDEDYKFSHKNFKNLNKPLKKVIIEKWYKNDGIIFISATGIALRLIKDLIEDKNKDPAIIVIDDMGKYIIPILSGHLGGANEASNYLANKLSSQAIITTATDNRGIEGVDLFAKKNNYYMENMTIIKDITALTVNGETIGFYGKGPILDYENIKKINNLNDLNDIKGLIIVSDKLMDLNLNIPVAFLRPQNINIGIGSRKDIDTLIVIEAIKRAFKKAQLSINSINEIATVEVKKDEKGILEAVKYFNRDLKIYTIEELKRVEELFKGSDFVKNTIGVSSVSDPCAYLLGSDMLLEKFIYKGVTVSLSRRKDG